MREKIEEAVREAISSAPPRGFKESVDLAINLHNIDLSQPANRIDAEVILPHGRGRPSRVAVFAAGETAMRAKAAGADLVIPPDEIKELGNNKRTARKLAEQYEYFIAETQFMPGIGKSLGPILGKRGKMPAPLPPTADVTPMINRMRNLIKVRSRDRLTFHVPIGSRDMEVEQLAENVDSVITKLEQTLKDGRQNLKSVYVKTTMGPAKRVI
ncbi:MAG: 50S ribosomal protein L1 [Methanosarcinales archaeon]|nr:50S ribosomal protein L1 [Methanosarcinales archaeon]